jgi:hypothetical protein
MSVMAGENMTELQVVEAVCRAAKRLDVSVVDFVAEPRWEPPAPGYYYFLVEFVPEKSVPPGGSETLARALEEALCEVNREYVGKRRWARLGPARVAIASPGTFDALRRKRIDAGASESRYKHPHLRIDVRMGPFTTESLPVEELS